MKRAHRSAHKWFWLVLAVLLAATLFGALTDRRDIPANDAVPSLETPGAG